MKTLVKSFIICLLTASTLNINAQNCSISGRIYSSETKKGILQASLLILDEDGFENIELLPLRLLGKNSNIDLAMLNASDAKKEKSETKKEATVMPAIFQAALKNFIGSN